MTPVSRDLRVDVTISLARTTWLMDERERFAARRLETRISSGVTLEEVKAGGRLSVEDAILGTGYISDDFVYQKARLSWMTQH